ncbi:unnamed protein product, partial [Strongylus vulgaris]
ECRHNLAFNSSIETERLIPVVSLPAKNGVLHPKVAILWEGENCFREFHSPVYDSSEVDYVVCD